MVIVTSHLHLVVLTDNILTGQVSPLVKARLGLISLARTYSVSLRCEASPSCVPTKSWNEDILSEIFQFFFFSTK